MLLILNFQNHSENERIYHPPPPPSLHIYNVYTHCCDSDFKLLNYGSITHMSPLHVIHMRK